MSVTERYKEIGTMKCLGAVDRFVFKPGPIFANVVLADEINRTSPRTLVKLMTDGVLLRELEGDPQLGAGIKKTLKAGPEVINFEQIQVGDQLKVTATEELVVYVAGEGETPADGGAQLVALAPKGAKPGALMAETTRVTAKVTAIDSNQHKATLQFEDGTTRTVAVRPDVDLSKRKVGDSVVIRITEALAIQVAKP